MKRALAVAVTLFGVRARAEEPVSLTVTGSSAPGFTTTAKEGGRPRDTPDAAALLEGLPGIRVRRLGGESAFATLSIRGAASNQVAVMIAGVPLTGAGDPSLDLSTLPLWPGAIARVHRTFAPAAFGGGYLGGLVDFAPMDLTSRRTETYNAYGSFGSYRLRLATIDRIAGFQVGAGIAYHRTEGDYRYYHPFLRGGEYIVRRNNDSEHLAGVIQARRDNDVWTWLVTAVGNTRRDGIAGPFNRPLFGTRMARDRQLVAVELRKRDDDGRLLARVWGRRDGFAFDDPLLEQMETQRAASQNYATGFTFGRTLRSGRLTIDPRFDGGFEKRAPLNYTRGRFGVSADATWRVSDSTSFVLATRADVRRDTGQRAELLPIAHLGAEHALSDSITLGAHIGTLARAPSFLELLGDGGVYSAAPGLRSERSYSADVGLRAHGKRNKLAWELEIVGFASAIRELIVTIPASFERLRAYNVGAARIAGAEVSLAATTGPIRASASYTRLYTENRTDVVSTRGAPLPGRPGHDLTFDASVKLSVVTVRYGLDLVAATTLDNSGLLELPARIFHTAGVRLDFRSVSVIGEVANIFDRRSVDGVDYEGGRRARYPISDFLGYPLPGRRFTLAVRTML